MAKRFTFLLTTAFSLLEALTLAAAHGHKGHATDVAGSGSSGVAPRPHPPNSTVAAVMVSSPASPSSYFSYAPHSGLMLAHILLMTLAWFFVLPVGESRASTEHIGWFRLTNFIEQA